MISLNCYKKKLVGVYGLGITGVAAIEALVFGGASVIAWDDNDSVMESMKDLLYEKRELYIAFHEAHLRFQRPSEEELQKMYSIVVSPGIPICYPYVSKYILFAREHNIDLVSDIELLQVAQPAASYIGITGTNGKSTTTALVGHILKFAGVKTEVGGNIGNPVLALSELQLGDVYTMEVSSFQLDLFANMHFDIAIALSIKPDHIDRHGSFENYFESKKKIFAHQDVLDHAVVSVNSGDAMLDWLSEQKRQNIIAVSSNKLINNGVSFISNKIIDKYFTGCEYAFEAPESLLGEHNAENIAAAFSVASLIGVAPELIMEAIRHFKALPHRMEVFHRTCDLRFINDSKATNSDAAYWALKTFDNIYWVLGGICKDDGIAALSEFFSKVKHAFLIGRAADDFAKTLEDYGVQYTISVDIQNAIKQIKSMNLKSGNVLLSPACASQDQWKNYEERGAKFKELILEIYS